MPCIFCGSDRVTREHVYRRAWIDRLVPHATGFTNTISKGYGDPIMLSTWPSSEADVVVRCVCANCNNGWMNAIDESAEEIVGALARGETRVRVVNGALHVFATWAMKMALVMSGMLTPCPVREEIRERFYRERRPPPGISVWVATMESYEGETRTTPMTLVSGVEVGAVEQAFLATFRVLHLVVQVLAPADERVRPEHDEYGARRTEIVWPRVAPLEWPLPQERMLRSDEDYFKLARSFRTNKIIDPGEGWRVA